MDRRVVEPNLTIVIEPGKGVLKPIFTVSLRKVFLRTYVVNFRLANSRMKTNARLGEHIV